MNLMQVQLLGTHFKLGMFRRDYWDFKREKHILGSQGILQPTVQVLDRVAGELKSLVLLSSTHVAVQSTPLEG